MIRLLFLLLLVIGAAFCATWLSDNSGLVAFNWLGYRVETSTGFFIVSLIVSFLLLFLSLEILLIILNSPSKIKKIFSRKDEEINYSALENGFLNLISGDIKEADKSYNLLKKRIKNDNKYTNLFNAFEAKLLKEKGSYLESKQAYNKLLKNKKTKFFATKGLLENSIAEGSILETKKYAEAAYQMKPDFKDGAHSLLALHKKTGDIEEIFNFLNKYKSKHRFKKDYNNEINLEKELSNAYYLKAQKELSNGNNKVAIENILKSLKADNSNEESIKLLIDLAVKENKISELKKYYKKYWVHNQEVTLTIKYLNNISEKDNSKKLIIKELATLEKAQKNEVVIAEVKSHFLENQ